LAGLVKRTKRNAIRSVLEVGVLVDNTSGIAAELENHPLPTGIGL
jgi:hypothetical protein